MIEIFISIHTKRISFDLKVELKAKFAKRSHKIFKTDKPILHTIALKIGSHYLMAAITKIIANFLGIN